jgi:hypothetical protein
MVFMSVMKTKNQWIKRRNGLHKSDEDKKPVVKEKKWSS